MRMRNLEANCGNCAYYIPQNAQEGRPSECRQARPVPLLIPVMVPVPGTPIMVPGRNGHGGPQMKQALSAEFPMFTPIPEFWCGQHPDFWLEPRPKANLQLAPSPGAASVDQHLTPDAA